MRRQLALHAAHAARRALAAAAALACLVAVPARAGEPLDLDLTRLGAPSAAVWEQIGVDPATAGLLAADARVRFGRLASDLGLAFSSTLLQPASTTGQSGFAFDMEGAYAGVGGGTVGGERYPVDTAVAASYPRGYWPTAALVPHELFIPSVHVRKSFPFSLEVGGRLQYLSQSSYFAAQLEGKWALVEGFWVLPDVALRAAYTMMLGHPQLSLSTTEFDVMISKRFGANAVTSLTPYAAARFTLLDASTPSIRFLPEAQDPTGGSSAPFPTLNAFFYRTTVGVRLTSFAVSLAAEATWFTGATAGKAGAGPAEYPEFKVPGSWSGAAKLGFEF